MAILGFPYQIRVKLGNGFNGTGNGLNEGDVLILTNTTRNPPPYPVGATWTEAPIGDPLPSDPNPSTNRIKAQWFGNQFQQYLCRYASSSWVLMGIGMATGGGPADYTFLDFYKLGKNGSPTLGASYYVVSFAYRSYVPSLSSLFANGVTGQGPTVMGNFTTHLFTEMEEYVAPVRGDDKTTYRYG